MNIISAIKLRDQLNEYIEENTPELNLLEKIRNIMSGEELHKKTSWWHKGKKVQVYYKFHSSKEDTTTNGFTDELLKEIQKVAKLSHFYSVVGQGMYVIFEDKE